jgi:hypothetical protein
VRLFWFERELAIFGENGVRNQDSDVGKSDNFRIAFDIMF